MVFISPPEAVGVENVTSPFAPASVKLKALPCRSTGGVPAGYGAVCTVPTTKSLASFAGADSQYQRAPSGDSAQSVIPVAMILRLALSPMVCIFRVAET